MLIKREPACLQLACRAPGCIVVLTRHLWPSLVSASASDTTLHATPCLTLLHCCLAESPAANHPPRCSVSHPAAAHTAGACSKQRAGIQQPARCAACSLAQQHQQWRQQPAAPTLPQCAAGAAAGCSQLRASSPAAATSCAPAAAGCKRRGRNHPPAYPDLRLLIGGELAPLFRPPQTRLLAITSLSQQASFAACQSSLPAPAHATALRSTNRGVTASEHGCTCAHILIPLPVPCPPSALPPQGSQASVSNVPLGAIPNYGGKTSEGTTASYHRWGMDKVPAPREIVDCLGEYVIGQVRERGMKAAPGPLIWLWLC